MPVLFGLWAFALIYFGLTTREGRAKAWAERPAVRFTLILVLTLTVLWIIVQLTFGRDGSLL